jgi:uncharacterized protein (TIGR03437 family)
MFPALLGATVVPVSFERNRGAAPPPVQYLARAAGYTVLLMPTEALLSFPADGSQAAIRLAGANPAPRVEGLEPRAAVTSYFLGKDRAEWTSGVPHYGRVLYREVYAGIDLVYYLRGGRVEFDFLVAAGADPARIRLQIEGPGPVRADANGDLVLRTAAGEFRQHRPRIFQGQAEIEGRYEMREDRTVGFQIGRYDASRPLVIDPELSFATFLGGSGTDRVFDVAVDGSGHMYLVGTTSSTTLAVAGLAGPGYAGGADIFVAKLRPDGKSLVYLTYLGGRLDDVGYAIAVDGAGNAYVTGETDSANFPTTPNAFQSSFGGGNADALLVKLDPAGALLYSSYLGGRNDDGGNGLAVDAAGHAYLTGYAGSFNFPTTAGAAQPSHGGGDEDAFAARLNPGASGPASLVWSTLLGGSAVDSAYAIALGPAGVVYVAGSTASRNFPVTDGAYQRLNLSLTGTQDAFLSRFSADGARLEYSTYIGGEANESGNGIAVDAAGHVYLAGVTESTLLLPAGGRPYQPRLGGSADAFLAKLNPAAAGREGLVWATYLGGTLNDGATRVAVDAAGNAYLAGGTESANFPTTAGALQAAFSGSGLREDDAFLARFSPAGSLLYSTFLGSRGVNTAWGVALDTAGNAVVVGATSAASFPVTAGALQPSYGGGDRDGFVARIQFAEAMPEPRLAAGGIVNAASFAAGGVAPGEIATLFGSQIGPAALTGLRLTGAGRVETVLAETRILFDGVAAPLLYVSANQGSAIVPYAVAGRATTQVQVEYRGVRSPAVSVAVAPSAPGLFTLNASGGGPGAFLNQDYSVNSASNPAARGSAVILFATGEGQTNPPGADGKLAADPLPAPLLPVSVTIGGQPAAVLYAGGAPGLVAGVLQVNVRIPEGVTPGPAVPVGLTVGNASSQSGVTLAVR